MFSPIKPDDSYDQAADETPSNELVRSVGARVMFHVRNGHFEIAARVLVRAEKEWQDERAEQKRILSRSGEEWLERPLGEFELLVRTQNLLEEAGCVTMRQALELLNSGQRVTNLGPGMEQEVWNAARERKITQPQTYKRGGKSM